MRRGKHERHPHAGVSPNHSAEWAHYNPFVSSWKSFGAALADNIVNGERRNLYAGRVVEKAEITKLKLKREAET
jgi:hypothetical protein